MKDLDDVKIAMGTLYDEVRAGTTELKTASELANIAGKFLKAEQLKLAREIFTSHAARPDLAIRYDAPTAALHLARDVTRND